MDDKKQMGLCPILAFGWITIILGSQMACMGKMPSAAALLLLGARLLLGRLRRWCWLRLFRLICIRLICSRGIIGWGNSLRGSCCWVCNHGSRSRQVMLWGRIRHHWGWGRVSHGRWLHVGLHWCRCCISHGRWLCVGLHWCRVSHRRWLRVGLHWCRCCVSHRRRLRVGLHWCCIGDRCWRSIRLRGHRVAGRCVSLHWRWCSVCGHSVGRRRVGCGHRVGGRLVRLHWSTDGLCWDTGRTDCSGHGFVFSVKAHGQVLKPR